MTDWLVAAAGGLLVLVTLRDIFRTLWHPRGVGRVCRLLFRGVWAVTRRASSSTELSGPVGLLVTAATWATLVVVGFALVYWPWMPGGFHFSSPLQPGATSDLLLSVYLSLVAVATLGLGDVMPATGPLRILVPLEALVGFILLTAVITWLLQIYPALAQRRALARRLTMLARTDAVRVVADGDTSVATQLLDSVTAGITDAEMNLVLYSESYYFRERDETVALAAALPAALPLVEAGRAASDFEVQHAAEMLRRAVTGLASVLGRYVAEGEDVTTTLAAFAADHGHRPVTES